MIRSSPHLGCGDVPRRLSRIDKCSTSIPSEDRSGIGLLEIGSLGMYLPSRRSCGSTVLSYVVLGPCEDLLGGELGGITEQILIIEDRSKFLRHLLGRYRQYLTEREGRGGSPARTRPGTPTTHAPP